MLASFSIIAVALATEAKAGLPQLNPHDFSPQLIWLVGTFIVLYVLMATVALPQVGGVIEDRAQRIQRDLDEAERLKTETDKALAEYEAALAAARGRAGGIAKEIRDKLAAEVEQQRSGVDKQVNARIADAERRIGDMKSRAMGEVGQIATETAEAIVAQLSGKPASRDQVMAAVQAVAGGQK